MKKALFKLAAIFLSVCLMLSAGITFSADETTDTIATYLAEKNYICTDTIFDGNRELEHTRIKEYYNWAGTEISADYYIEDQYGLQRIQANGGQYAYITMNVNSSDENVKVGVIWSNSYYEKGNAKNYYYTSSDGENWKPILPVATVATAKGTSYTAVEELIADMPVGTAYLRIVTDNPNGVNSWWNPLLDYIKIYELDITDTTRYESALDGYSDTATTVIEGYYNVFNAKNPCLYA